MTTIPKSRNNQLNRFSQLLNESNRFPAAEVRSNFSHIVKRAQINGDVIAITHHGNEVASVVSQSDALFIRWMVEKYGRDKLTKFEKWLERQANPSDVDFDELGKFFERHAK